MLQGINKAPIQLATPCTLHTILSNSKIDDPLFVLPPRCPSHYLPFILLETMSEIDVDGG